MNTIEYFQHEAVKAFRRGKASVHVHTAIEASTLNPGLRFRVIVGDESQTNSGSASSIFDAINKCKSAIAQDHADRIEAAKKLLADAGEI